MTALIRSVELGSFSSAARELGFTASALSKVISRLEARLGVRLLQRTSRSLALTQDGEIFMAGARRVIDALSDAENAVGVSTSRLQGKIRLYSLPAFALRLAPLISAFLKKYPEVTIDLQTGTDRLDLIKFGIDVAIRIGALEDSGAYCRKLCESEWIVCAAPSYLERRGVPTEASHLPQHNCLNFAVHTHTIPWQFLDGAKVTKPSVSGNFLSNQADLLRSMALDGLGIIRVSDHVVSADIAEGRLVRLLEGQLAGKKDIVWAVHRNKDQVSHRVSVLLDYLVEHLQRVEADITMA